MPGVQHRYTGHRFKVSSERPLVLLVEERRIEPVTLVLQVQLVTNRPLTRSVEYLIKFVWIKLHESKHMCYMLREGR